MSVSLSEKQLLDILSLGMEAYAIYTTDDIIIETANEVMLGFWGKDKSVIGLGLEEAVPELKGQPFKAMLQEVLRTGVDKKGVIPATTKVDNLLQTSYYEYWYRAIRDKNGIPYAIMHTAYDVTERVENREALQVAENAAEIQRRRLHGFFMQAPAGICIFDGPELTFELVNPKYQELFPGRELLGKKLLDALPEIKGQPIWEILTDVYMSGKTFEGKSHLIPLPKSQPGVLEDRYFNFIYQARRGDNGDVDGLLVFVFEVTDIAQAQHEMRKSQDFLELAIDASDIGVWTADLTNDSLTVNPRARKLHGLGDDQEITLSEAIMLIAEEYRQQVQESLKQAIDNRASFTEEYYVLPLNGGKPRWLKSNGKAYYGEDGRALYISGTIADLTEQIDEENRKNDFIGMVSHELKTPLTSINAIIQVCQFKLKDNRDKFLHDAMGKAQVQAKRMSNMINSFLNISRLESGKIQLIREPFDINVLLEEAVEEMGMTASTHRILFDNCSPITVDADRDKMASVILNLLSNAVKYSAIGSEIIVKCKSNEAEVVVSVADEGIGLSEYDAKRIFNRYFRVESDETKRIAGFGIGLYLSAEIIQLHQGRIWVESEKGQQSVFSFSLPLTDAHTNILQE